MAHHLGVCYRYEHLDEDTDSTASELPGLPQTLQSLPAKWLEHLQQAAIQADRDWILQLIDQLPSQHTVLKNRLTPLINQFDFDTLLELTDLTEKSHALRR